MDTNDEIELTIGRLKDAKVKLEDAYTVLVVRNDFLARQLKDCQNELCLKCGEYKTAHLGSCNGCRWKDVWE